MTSLDPADAALVDALTEPERGPNGVPSRGEASSRASAYESARAVLRPWLAEDGLRVSVLGPEWSSDIDAHVRTGPDAAVLLAAGWLPLGRVGYPDRWAVVRDGRVVGGVDIVGAPRPPAVDAVITRCRRRGEVRLRDVLELRVLARRGDSLAAVDADEVLRAAAAIEEALGGAELTVHRGLPPQRPPVALARPASANAHAAAGRVRRLLRVRTVIAFSGVDGSGKSSLTSQVAAALGVAGVPASIVWSRPGMNLGPLSRLAKAGRKAVGQGDAPGVRAVAAGSAQLPSRKGLVGALWATVVAVAFAVDVRRQHASAAGVVLYDRHLADALVTLEFVYAGAWLGAARAIARLALPRADVAFYVDVPAEIAVARKPGDTFGDHAVRSQLDLYQRHVRGSQVTRLDGTRPLDELVAEALSAIAR